MGESETRTVGERGQITLPKVFREAFGIEGGDELVIRAADGKLVIEKPVSRRDLSEGYRRRAERDAELADELDGVSLEADATLGDAPDW